MLKQFLKAAAKACDADAPEVLTPDILRFTFEYAQAPSVEAERQRVAKLIGSTRFQLFPLPPGADPLILVLQFPGVAREQTAGFLFEIAQNLIDELGLVSCVPDVDPGWVADDDLLRAAPESVGDIVGGLCKSDATPPKSKRWAIKAIRADKAWNAFGATGAGILVGQPDTGVADHSELDQALDIAKGIDILAGSGPPIDPLAPSMKSPGHGTATSSTVASRASLDIIGSAPGTKVVPVRCLNSVVIGAGGSVAAAIDHARGKGCHVITMSLGGPLEGSDLKRAIARAVDAGMIVLAAAGNCVGFVVYPAWDKNVIAVAAVDEHDKRWKGSSHGAKVDISAPGENVFVARRNSPSDTDKSLVEPGQGTSFAVALTAGCAALWLSHHTPAKVRAEAAKRGTTVQALFRAAVNHSARKPSGWNKTSMGAGIVDAHALLSLALGSIPVVGASTEANPGAAIIDAAGNQRRFVAEAGYLAADALQRNNPARAGALESAVQPRPSEALRKAAGSALGRAAPAASTGPKTPYVGPRRPGLAVPQERDTGRRARPALTATTMVEKAGQKQTLDRLEKVLSQRAPRGMSAEAAVRARSDLMARAEAVVSMLGTGSSTGLSRFALNATTEAIVRLTDRPAIRVVDGKVDVNDPQLESWAGQLAVSRNALKPLVDAVGRIDILEEGTFVHIGTGTLIAPGLVMTNRHVIDAFAEPIPAAKGKQRFILNAPVSICFDETATDEKRRFSVKGVVTAGPAKIGQEVDLANLDMAILEVETSNAAGKALPKPAQSGLLQIGPGAQSNMIVVGYPGAPPLSAAIDPETGQVSEEILNRLWDLFSDDYGIKYISPGRISNDPGTIVGDPAGWAFGHDATTLGGVSGAPVISLHAPHGIGGLHFGGEVMRQNLAHDLATIRAAVKSDKSLLDVGVIGSFFKKS